MAIIDPTIPPVTDKAVKPPGVLPRNAQAWVLGGISLLMIGVIAISGNRAPQEPGGSKMPQAAPAADPNAARIQEYRQRIEEQTRKLQLEQAQLAQAQQALLSGAASPTAGVRSGPHQSSAGSLVAHYPSPVSPEQNWLQTEKAKREYTSLFAPSLALSYRHEFQAQQVSAARERSVPIANLTRYSASSPEGEAVRSGEETAAKRKNSSDDFNRAAGKEYRLFEGTVIETVLTNRLDGAFSGPVNCMVTTNIYSHDRQRLLIPQGSRVLGEVKNVETFGQKRLAVFFHRLIMPDGYSVSLDQFKGLNQVGETGLRDQVNHHYLQVFGVSIAIGAIAGLSQANTRYGLDSSGADAYRQGVASSLSQSSLRILDRYLNVLPTFTIREGHRVKVYLSDDLLLPAYEKHQMPSDL